MVVAEWSLNFGENCWDRDLIRIIRREQTLKAARLQMKDAYDLIKVMRSFISLADQLNLGFDRWGFCLDADRKGRQGRDVYCLSIDSYQKIKLSIKSSSHCITKKKAPHIKVTACCKDLGSRKNPVSDRLRRRVSEGPLEIYEVEEGPKEITFLFVPPSHVKRNEKLKRIRC